jgi:hypothetical protein
MPATQINGSDLLQAVKQMGPDEFNAFVEQAYSLRSPTRSARLSANESKLIQRINRGIPAEVVRRYAHLVRKRKTKDLSSSEQTELLKLANDVETRDAERAEALLELAQLRRVPVRVLMKEMGIKAAPVHG